MSWLDREIARVCDKTFAEATAPGGWLREQIALHIRWHMHGFEPGFGLKERQEFTASVAGRLRARARDRVRLFGIPLWARRRPEAWCADMAESVVTNFLESDRIKFGDPRYDWSDGCDLADEEMSYWEAA